VRALDQTLIRSRVYRKASRNMSTDSFNTSGTGNSRLSIGDISNVSTTCLPVYIVKLTNGQVYLQMLQSTADGKVDGCPYPCRHCSMCTSARKPQRRR